MVIGTRLSFRGLNAEVVSDGDHSRTEKFIDFGFGRLMKMFKPFIEGREKEGCTRIIL